MSMNYLYRYAIAARATLLIISLPIVGHLCRKISVLPTM